MNLTIVPFTEAYLDDIVNIENASFTDPWSREALDSSSKMPLTEIYLATDEGGVLCGYVVFICISPECEILNIAVSPEHRRKGVANALVSFVCERSREKNCDTLMLEVRESNISARALYEKHGFEVVGRRKAYYRTPTEDAILMDKKSDKNL